MASSENNDQIIDIIVNADLLTEQQASEIMAAALERNQCILSVIIESGLLNAKPLLEHVASRLGIDYRELKNISVASDVLSKVPLSFVSHYTIMPLSYENGLLNIAVVDPFDICLLDDVSSFLNMEIKPVLAAEDEILEAVHRYYGLGAGTVHKLFEGKAPVIEKKDHLIVTDKAEETSIVSLVNTVLREAIKLDATDVHLEPQGEELRARFRIDGILQDIILPESIVQFYPSIISRIKILAKLDIAEKRLPQDGRIQLKLDGIDIDLRVSTMPLVDGEGIHLRVLRQHSFLDFKAIGCLPEHLKLLESSIIKPHGIILVTGPTGSGKSTTLYACLDKVNSDAVKIITVEDPVEYNLKGINQIQVQPKIGLTFAEGLRHILRHDPDVLMVGEIRDSETAEIAIRAALTGHLVFSTLHTNDAAGTIARLLDMNFEPFLISSSLECIVAQRLLRKLCPLCMKKTNFNVGGNEEHEILELSKLNEVYEAVGCEECRNTGYKGRTAIFEIMVISDELRELILKRASSQQIKDQAVSEGMKTLLQDGLDKAAQGLTSIAEVLRVTKEE